MRLLKASPPQRGLILAVTRRGQGVQPCRLKSAAERELTQRPCISATSPGETVLAIPPGPSASAALQRALLHSPGLAVWRFRHWAVRCAPNPCVLADGAAREAEPLVFGPLGASSSAKAPMKGLWWGAVDVAAAPSRLEGVWITASESFGRYAPCALPHRIKPAFVSSPEISGFSRRVSKPNLSACAVYPRG